MLPVGAGWTSEDLAYACMEACATGTGMERATINLESQRPRRSHKWRRRVIQCASDNKYAARVRFHLRMCSALLYAR
jgi:hypothetical protein